MKNNTLEIDINPIIIKKEKKAGFSFTIKINGVPINESHHVDLYEILYFVTKPERKYAYFWNCDCGIPECAGIEPSLIKEGKNHSDIMVIIPVPCSTNDFKDLPEEFKNKGYEYWQANHKKKVVRLNREDIARKLWDLSFELEKKVESFSKDYQLLFWPATTSYYEYEWPRNLPVYIRTFLLKHNFTF